MMLEASLQDPSKLEADLVSDDMHRNQGPLAVSIWDLALRIHDFMIYGSRFIRGLGCKFTGC